MSTLTVSTISNGSVSTSSTNVIQGSAKAWVAFNGSSGSIFASYNVSSISVIGTGRFTANFTNAFADSNYSISASCAGATSPTGGGSSAVVCNDPIAPTRTTTQVTFSTINNADTAYISPNYVGVSIFR
jgi:outer membrane protein assembly factor BamB